MIYLLKKKFKQNIEDSLGWNNLTFMGNFIYLIFKKNQITFFR